LTVLLLNFVTLLCFYVAEFLRNGLEEEGISVDGKKFEPHATIMKLSKVPPKKLKINGKHGHSLTLLL
jgi:2'-5' RNA ligase